MNSALCELSIVIPLFNEEENIPELVSDFIKLKTMLPSSTEIIFVDDGSMDATAKLIKKIKLPFTILLISLSRNFGHQSALLAGLEKAAGKFVVTMDGDLQHPPELIPKMLEQHRKGIDIVLTQRLDGQITSRFKKMSAHCFYQLMNTFSEVQIGWNTSDFRSLNRVALDNLLALPEKRKFLRGMTQWLGFSVITLPFQVQPRRKGKSKYSVIKMLKLALYGISSFSTMPLYLSGLFSLVLFASALLYAVYVLYVRFIVNDVVSGWASLLFVLLIIGGFLSFFLGVIGMYLAAIYDEVKQRPNYIIQDEKKL